ncbi:MAG TPA: hypothetical protein DDW52_17855, partial [Planctomycetaceae bacterium]|nr:hypothetical protein [Planctomycetaceae bacterium]
SALSAPPRFKTLPAEQLFTNTQIRTQIRAMHLVPDQNEKQAMPLLVDGLHRIVNNFKENP